ncbi:MAG: hypothetical protein HY897_05260 [Deltaproteobacteria bacterium]|nr:hypothetical protein [Deltaproteobacteria bacterium]
MTGMDLAGIVIAAAAAGAFDPGGVPFAARSPFHHYPFPHRVEQSARSCGAYDAETDTFIFCVSELRGGASRAVTAKKLAESPNGVLLAEVFSDGSTVRVAGGPQGFIDGFQEVHDLETPRFGAASDIDGDGRVWILVCDLGDWPGAYFDPAFTNGRDMLVFDYRIDDARQFSSHELMHDILGNYDVGEAMWIYEGTAMYGTHFWSGKGPYGDGRHMEYIGWLKSTDIPLNWHAYDPDPLTSMAQYEIAYLFMLYLSDSYGGPDLIGDIMRDGPSFDPAANAHVRGIEGVEAALSRRGAPKTFAQIFDDWVVATYLNRCPEANNEYCYATTREHAPPAYRHDTYPARGYGLVNPWAGQAVVFSRPGLAQGTLTVAFDGDTGAAYTVRVAAHDSARQEVPVVFDLQLDSENNGTLSYPGLGVDYDYVSMIVAHHAQADNVYFRWETAFAPVEPPDAGAEDTHWYFDAGYDAAADTGGDAAERIVEPAGCGCTVLGI